MNYLLALAFVFSASAPKNTFSNDFVNPIKTTSVKTISYDEIHDQAIFNCPWAKRIDEDKEKIVSLLIDVEKQYALPGALRGRLVAGATAIRAPKPGGRCGERPLFYRVLRKWHRAIKQERDNSNRFTNNGTDGC